MVVGIASYQDRSEAYPLDRATLRKIVLRSFLVRAGRNGETGESIGWAWAMAPGLKKIHTNEEDLALAMGHHLEYVDTGYFLAPLVMGALLAMEQQKFDPETLRSVRTGLAGFAKSVSRVVVGILLAALLLAVTQSSAAGGSMAAAAVYGGVLAAVSVILRFASMSAGYHLGTRIAEKTAKNPEALKKASVKAGAFMIGAASAVSACALSACLPADAVLTGPLSALFSGYAAVIPFGMTMLLWYLMERRNWSLAKCALLVLAVAALLAAAAVTGGYITV